MIFMRFSLLSKLGWITMNREMSELETPPPRYVVILIVVEKKTSMTKNK